MQRGLSHSDDRGNCGDGLMQVAVEGGRSWAEVLKQTSRAQSKYQPRTSFYQIVKQHLCEHATSVVVMLVAHSMAMRVIVLRMVVVRMVMMSVGFHNSGQKAMQQNRAEQ